MIAIGELQTEKNILKELVSNGVIDEEIMFLTLAKLEMGEIQEVENVKVA